MRFCYDAGKGVELNSGAEKGVEFSIDAEKGVGFSSGQARVGGY